MEIMKNMLFWSQFKFRITFQMQFLERNIFFHILFMIFFFFLDIKQRKTKEIISTLFYIIKTKFLIFV